MSALSSHHPKAGVVPTLAISAHGAPAAVADPFDHSQIVYEGWMLKKRRRKMQGFARRYFMLTQGGMLAYALQPDGPVRDQIALRMRSFITSSVSRREIHIDGTHVTFHVRALAQDDFEQWMTALRKFVVVRQGPDTLKKLSMPRTHSFPLATLANKSLTVARDMLHTINQLDEVFLTLNDDDSVSVHRPSQLKAKKEKEHGKESSGQGLFGMFKRPHQSPAPPEQSHDIASSSSSRPQSTITLDQTTLERLHFAIETLRAQHAVLLDSITTLAQTDIAPPSSGRLSANLAPHAEVSEEPTAYTPILSPHARQMSIATHHSRNSFSSGSIWFDAEDGAEELILDDEPEDTAPIIVDDAASEESVEAALPATPQEARMSSPNHAGNQTPMQPEHSSITRRTRLPVPASTEEVSMIGVFRKNIGKDLSTVSMPVLFNEPISVLQRLDEDLEYSDLLAQAVSAIDPVERMAFVAALVVSGYCSTQFRAQRKPFNPMLGETYEDERTKFIAEKVSHQPPIMACHAEGDEWEYWATFSSKSKFWGKSYEITPIGTTHLRIGDDHYSWQRPSTYMRNIVGGQRYLEHTGTVMIVNNTTSLKCQLEFKETGYFGGTPNVVAGTIITARNKVEAKLEGKWHEGLALVTGPQSLRMLWRANTFPPDAMEYYGFTEFTATLNEITPDIADKLPPTDSRLRPDQRALEDGDSQTAEEEKQRVEDLQRERRRRGQDAQPKWFKHSGDEWVYAGGYWEQREKGWENPVPLW
ncbi:Oxysterol-binding protein-domain-containing protein [Auriculariales sp. MPI-PUGE-AT-0066]|nr:Oxysterol-binding protein-domain-containing protein [Auriculariales sp. MPI-PUGE-AT-0066]